MTQLPSHKLQRRRIAGLPPAEQAVVAAIREYYHHRRVDRAVQQFTPLLGAAIAGVAGNQLVTALEYFISGYRVTPTVAKPGGHQLTVTESYLLQALRSLHKGQPDQAIQAVSWLVAAPMINDLHRSLGKLARTLDNAAKVTEQSVAPISASVERCVDLHRAELALLSMLRLWVRDLQRQQSGLPALERYCRSHRLPPALAAKFDTVMCIIANAARRSIDVRCPLCHGLSPDEARLLAAVAAAQHGDRTNKVLTDFIEPAGLRLLNLPFDALAASLSRAQLNLPLRRWDFGLLGSRAAPAPASFTVTNTVPRTLH